MLDRLIIINELPKVDLEENARIAIQHQVDIIFQNARLNEDGDVVTELGAESLIQKLCLHYSHSGVMPLVAEKIKSLRRDEVLEKEKIIEIVNEGANYHPSKELSLEQITKLYGEVGNLIDTYIPDDVKKGLWVIRDSIGFIQKVRELKTQYGYYGFRISFGYAEELRWLMWFESRTEEESLQILTNREIELTDGYWSWNNKRCVDDGSSPLDRVLKNIYDANKGVHEYKPQKLLSMLSDEPAFLHDITRVRSAMDKLNGDSIIKTRPGTMFVSDFHIGMGLSPLGSRDSGGHGYDISTNGGRHKKVVTGKAGNKFPVPKRRGVK